MTTPCGAHAFASYGSSPGLASAGGCVAGGERPDCQALDAARIEA
jgi:hypothetical protein